MKLRLLIFLFVLACGMGDQPGGGDSNLPIRDLAAVSFSEEPFLKASKGQLLGKSAVFLDESNSLTFLVEDKNSSELLQAIDGKWLKETVKTQFDWQKSGFSNPQSFYMEGQQYLIYGL